MPKSTQDAALAAINYAIQTECGIDFLRCWTEGDFVTIRKEWPDAPEAVFVGADPLYVPASADLGPA
jgi:hypothetical protein